MRTVRYTKLYVGMWCSRGGGFNLYSRGPISPFRHCIVASHDQLALAFMISHSAILTYSSILILANQHSDCHTVDLVLMRRPPAAIAFVLGPMDIFGNSAVAEQPGDISKDGENFEMGCKFVRKNKRN